MKHSYTYLEQCVETFKDVTLEDVANLEISKVLGRGSSATTYAAGNINALSLDIPVAVKFRHDEHSIEPRLRKELAVAGLLTERIPSLLDTLPRFMATVAVLGTTTNKTAILTEDATHQGAVGIIPSPPSTQIHTALQEAFVGEKGLMAVFEDRELDSSVFFQVGDKQRILDLTPGPFMWMYERQSPDYRRHYTRVKEVYAAGVLRAEVSADSHFATTLCRNE